MTAKDYLTLGVSILALAWGIISFLISRRGNKVNHALAEKARQQAGEANDIAKLSMMRLSAESEIAILGMINAARTKVIDNGVMLLNIQAGVAPSKLSSEQKRQIEGLQQTWESAYEMLLNTYELACGLYLDDKIDKQRFKRQFVEEIKGLMDSEDQYVKGRLHAANTPYRAFRKVYDEWNNLEQ